MVRKRSYKHISLSKSSQPERPMECLLQACKSLRPFCAWPIYQPRYIYQLLPMIICYAKAYRGNLHPSRANLRYCSLMPHPLGAGLNHYATSPDQFVASACLDLPEHDAVLEAPEQHAVPVVFYSFRHWLLVYWAPSMLLDCRTVDRVCSTPAVSKVPIVKLNTGILTYIHILYS